MTIKPDVRLNVAKIVEGGVAEVYVGDSIVYVITVTNNGNSTATNVNVTEKLSNLVVVTKADTVTGSWNNDTGVWNVGSLAGNGASATLRLTVKVVGNGTVANAVVVNSTENVTDVPSNSTNVTAKPDVKLDIVKNVTSDISDVHVGDSIVYTITVTNNGKSTATDINVTEKLSDLVVVTDAKGEGNWNNGTKVWHIDSIEGSKNATLTLTVLVVKEGNVTNAVVAKAKENTTEVETNATNVTANPDVKLHISKVVNVSSVYVGDSIVYTITVVNNGKSTATDVNVTEKLSGLVVVTDATGDGKWNNNNNIWHIDSIESGKDATLTLTVLVTKEGNVTNAVVAKAKENDTEVETNATNVTANPNVELVLSKVANVSSVKVGDSIEYIITVINNGKSTATDVYVTEKLSNLVVVTKATGDGSWDNDTKVWYIDSLAGNGASAKLTLTVLVVKEGNVTNAVVATSKENNTKVETNATNVTANPDVKLDIVKEVISDISNVYVGDTIVYTITVTNNGKSTATDINVTEKLSNLVIVKDAVGDGSWDNDTKIWHIDSIDSNKAATLTLTVLVVKDGNVTNAVVATAKENQTEVETNATNVTAKPDVKLDVVKVANVTSVKVGDSIEYTITVINNGKSTATDINVTEKLSKLVVVTKATGDGSWNNGTKVWHIDSIDNNKAATLTLTVLVVKDGNVTNAVVATAKENNTEVETNATNVTANPNVELVLSKVANVTSVKVGDCIEYIITVINNGKSTATDVYVTEKLSDLVVVTKATGDGSWNNGTKVWHIDSIDSNKAATLTLTVLVVKDGNVTNAVVATAKENQTEVETNATNVTADPDVRLDIVKDVISDIGNVYVGDTIVYTITVTNNGKSTATDINVTEKLSNLVIVKDAVGDGSWNNGTNVWHIDSIDSNKAATLTLTVLVVKEGTVTNAVVASAKENNTEVESNATNVTANPDVRLDVVKQVANITAVTVGDHIVYTITVINNGKSTATDVNVIEKLSDLVVVTSAIGDGSWNNGTNVWHIDSIDSNKAASLTLTVLVVEEGTVTNAVVATAKENNTEVETNATNITAMGLVDVAISLSVDNENPDIGSEVTITLTVRNNGPSLATYISGKLNKDFLSALRIISIDSDDIKFNEGVLGYALSDALTVNEDGTFEIYNLDVNKEVSATIKAQILRDGDIVVDGVVSSIEKDSNLSNNHDEITMHVHSLVDLSVNKTVNNMNPTVGDIIEYTITVFNAGPSNATNVVVIEKLPESLIYQSDNAKGKYNHKTGIWNIGTVKANETKELTIKVKVNAIGKITNTVNVSSDEDNINPHGSTNNITINSVPKVVDLKVTVEVNNTHPKAGDFVEITITIVNQGNKDATGVKVFDKIPDGLKYISDDGEGNYDPYNGIWDIGNLPAGQTKVLHILVQATKVGNMTYTVTVTANEEIKDPESAKDNVTIEVVEPEAPIDNVTSDNVPHDDANIGLKPAGNPFALLVVALLSIGLCLTRRKQ